MRAAFDALGSRHDVHGARGDDAAADADDTGPAGHQAAFISDLHLAPRLSGIHQRASRRWAMSA